MYKKRSNKHSKSKSNTINFRIGYKSKTSKNATAKTNAANIAPNKAPYTPPNLTINTSSANKPNCKPFTLPPLTQTFITTNIGNHTSPSTSASTFYPKIRTDTNISISSEYHPPHSPSASYSFSENNSLTNPDFIVIEPQYPTHSHFIHQKHFHPHYHNRPQSTPQLKSFKFDDNNVHIITSQMQSNNSATITPTQADNVNVAQLAQLSSQQHEHEHEHEQTEIQQEEQRENTQPEGVVSPSEQTHLSQTERFQQLMPDSSTTAMTPTPSPSAPNASWNINSTNVMVPLEHLDLSNSSNSSIRNNNTKLRRYSQIKEKNMDCSDETEANVQSDNIKNVKIGQTTMHPYRVYNEPATALTATTHLLEKPAQSTHSIYSIDTEHSISRSFGIDDESSTSTCAIAMYPNHVAPPCNNHAVKMTKMTTATTATRQKIKKLKVNLTPTTSTPIRSPDRNNSHYHNNSHHNVTWQTYIGHFVFHEHDRGHSLYHSFKKIGEGVFARVYKTVRKDPQRTVALKVFPKKNLHAEGSFANELMLLHNVSHPNIVKLYDAHVDPKYFYLEMEVCRGGDIFKHLSRFGRIDERFSCQIIYKVVDAIRCFHERDFVHRDLKPENIVFVHKNDITDIRLIDFGESIHVDPQKYYNEFVGTPCYFAPERFRQHTTGAELKKSDVWAIGVIMFEMLTGCRCFNGGDNQYEVQSNVMARKTEQWPPDLTLSDDAMDFWNKLLDVEPLRRYSCQQALRHQWLMNVYQHKSRINPYSSPRLTPLQAAAAVQSPPQQAVALENEAYDQAMQAIVIQTSQSMTNLQSVFKRQIDAHNLRKKAQQRKYKDLLDEAPPMNIDDRDENLQNVAWKLRITRKKSRSLEHNELQTTFRKDNFSGAYQKLSIPNKHAHAQMSKYRVKHRSNTFGANSNPNIDAERRTIYSSCSETLSTHASLSASICSSTDDMIELQSASTDVIQPILKHQKSLSSPAMKINSDKKPYHIDIRQVHEEDEDSTISYSGAQQTAYNENHEKKHSNSLSIYEHSCSSYTNEDNILPMNEDNTTSRALAPHPVIEDKIME